MNAGFLDGEHFCHPLSLLRGAVQQWLFVFSLAFSPVAGGTCAGKGFCLFFFPLAAAQAGFFQLHHTSVELLMSSVLEGCQMYRQYEYQCGLPWTSTSVDYADSCLEEF